MTHQQGPRIGVAVLVRDPEGRLLLGRRGKEPNYGKWVVPGGGIKFGEDWVVAGERELREETGLEIEIERNERPFVWQILSEGEHRIILFAFARVRGGGLHPASDLLDARFFTRDAIPRADLSPAIAPVLSELGW